MASLPATMPPRSLRTMSARPLPYSEESSMTNALGALRTSLMYFAAAGPWVASLPRMRWKVFQPFSDRAGLVAEAEMMLRPAFSKIGSAALDSPEKAGPTMPTSFLSVTAFCASPGAIAGSPWLSNEVSVTLQSAFFSLYWLTASSAPFLMLMPRFAASPVRAPKKPILRSHALPPPALASLVVPPQALSARAAATSGAPILNTERKTPPEVTLGLVGTRAHDYP